MSKKPLQTTQQQHEDQYHTDRQEATTACQLLDDGEQYWFDQQEVSELMEHNRQFEQTPVILQFFLDHFELCDDPKQGEWLTSTALFMRLKQIVGSAISSNSVISFGKHLANLPNLKSRRSSAGKMYLVKQRS